MESVLAMNALVGGDRELFRVNLATGDKTEIYPGPTGAKISILPGGTEILLGDSQGLLLLDLATWARTRFGLQDSLIDFLVEAGGTSALLMSYSSSSLLRFDLP